MNKNPIVAGWSNAAASWDAVLWAAAHADVTGRDLVLVHAEPESAAVRRGGHLVFGSGAEPAEEVLSIGAAVQSEYPELGVAVRYVRNQPARTLLDPALSPDLLVLGRAEQSDRRMLGALDEHIAAVSGVPVVHVPRRPTSGGETPLGPIVSAVTATPAGLAALRWAVEMGVRTRRPVIVMGSPDALADRRVTDVDGLRQTVALRPGIDPTDAAAEFLSHAASRGASLLVIGCHHDVDPWSIRLGPFAKQVLHTAEVPVLTVGVSAHDSP